MIAAIALWIDHQRLAHRFHRLVDPGIRKNIPFMRPMRQSPQSLCCFDEIVNPALTRGKIGSFDLVGTKRYPVRDDGFEPFIP